MKKRLVKSEWGLLHRRKTMLIKVHVHCDCCCYRHSATTSRALRDTGKCPYADFSGRGGVIDSNLDFAASLAGNWPPVLGVFSVACEGWLEDRGRYERAICAALLAFFPASVVVPMISWRYFPELRRVGWSKAERTGPYVWNEGRVKE